jgi:hypothetical protein
MREKALHENQKALVEMREKALREKEKALVKVMSCVQGVIVRSAQEKQGLEEWERKLARREAKLQQQAATVLSHVREQETLRMTIEVKKEKIEEALHSTAALGSQLEACKQRNTKLCTGLQSRAVELAAAKSSAHVQKNQLKTLQGKFQTLEQALECGICMERRIACAFVPCGHAVCGHADCPTAKEPVCPFCCARIKERIRLYGFGGQDSGQK